MAAAHKLWPVGKDHLRVAFFGGSEEEKKIVKSLVTEHYNSIPMRLRFKFLSQNDPSYSDIRIQFANESKSYIGRDAEAYPGQATMWLNMHPRLPSMDAIRAQVQCNVLHEFGHALGLVHEQKHPDCKAKWNYSKIMENTGWDIQKVRHAYDKDTSSVIDARWDKPYDRKSIMH